MQSPSTPLKLELARRCRKNPGYSLRAFARDIKIDPAHLSDFLNGKRGISKITALKIARILGFSKEEATHFADLVDAHHGRSQSLRAIAQARVLARVQARLDQKTDLNQTLAQDIFDVVSDWHHMALIQLMKLKDYQEDPEWMAKRLNISPYLVTDALERLERVGLIEKRGDRHFPFEKWAVSSDGIPSEAIRKFHTQILGLAETALDLQPVNERDFSTLLMPMALDKIPLARKRIREFTQSLCDEFSRPDPGNQVVSLGVQLFSLTQPNSEKEKPL